tara:strand:+ start:861 stop:1157 length:297 start_codon:yes stop_codon:yes gene_type:complete
MFWIAYIFISIFLCFLFSLFVKKTYLKLIIFNIFFSLFLSVWFINPGSETLAPVASIFLLELFIIDSSGLERILRPLVATFIFSFLVSLIYYFLRSKN